MTNVEKNDLGYLGLDFQYRLIHSFMENKEFFKDLHSIIDQNMFTDPSLKTYVGAMKEYYETQEAVPNYEIMRIILKDISKNEIDRELLLATVDKIQNTPSDSSDYINKLAEKFFKQQNIVKTANEILKIAGNGDTSQYEKCVELLNEAMSRGVHENFGLTVFDDLGETLSNDYRTVIPTGIEKLDEALEGGLGKGELGVIACSTGVGKALSVNELVLTPNGFIRMGDIKLGDKVIGRDGCQHNVIGVFPQGIRQLYRVSFANGSSCICDDEHLWGVYDEFNQYMVMPLKDIRHNEYKQNYYGVPFNKPVQFNKRDVKINPYDYGNNIKQYTCKCIDDDYLYNDLQNRIELLNGFLDRCGDIDSNGMVTVDVEEESLVKDIIYLIRSLGGDAYYDIIPRSWLKYHVTIELEDKTIPYFRDKKRQEYVNYFEKTKNVIKNIEYYGDEEAQCISIDSEDELYITKDFIVTHNTSMTTAMASYAATCKTEQNNYQGFKVLQIVFEDREKQIQRKHIGRITKIEAKDLSKPEYIDIVKERLNAYEDREMLNNNLRIIRLPNGEVTAMDIKRLIKKFANNGFIADLVIVDYFECLEHTGTSTNEYEKEGRTMRKFEAMVGELNIAMWIPSQGTKDAISQELVTIDKMGGSAKKGQIAHVIVTITRTLEDIANNRATLALMKNRAGKSGKVFNNVYFNNGTCIISTDDSDDCEDMVEYNSKKKKEIDDLASEIFKKIKNN